eukprot:6352587-Prymnesium_polylepis.2
MGARPAVRASAQHSDLLGRDGPLVRGAHCLMHATRAGSAGVVRALLAEPSVGAVIDVGDGAGATPLHVACQVCAPYVRV